MNTSPAIAIGHIRVKDAAKWEEYRSQVPATLAPWHAELLFRATLCDVFAGAHPYTDTVAIRFPDTDSMRAWYHSPAYQALIPLRQEAADVVLLGFEG